MIELLHALLLPRFPSGSSVTYYKTKLYLVGDDGTYVLVLDRAYREVDHIPLSEYAGVRIPKMEKADFETASVVSVQEKDYLLILGSASRANRKKALLIPFDCDELQTCDRSIQEVDLTPFTERLKAAGLESINIEGSAVAEDYLVLSNRANGKHSVNTLIITATDFWTKQITVRFLILPLILPGEWTGVVGISELCYVASRDLLLLTLSSEQTDNAIDDGTIGDSYIAWVHDFSKKLNSASVKPDAMLNLSAVDKTFLHEKIEGIALESMEGNILILHLVSDNDQGQSRLFKVKITLPASLPT